MYSCYNIQGSIKEISSTPSAAIIMTTIPQSTNGLNLLPSTGMASYSCISNDGTRIFVASSNSTATAAPCYSANGGASWSTSTFSPALPTTATNVWGLASSSDCKYILFNTDTNPCFPYKSIDYGATFTAWIASNFGGVNCTNAKWAGGVSDDGTVWTLASTNTSVSSGVWVCTNGTSTQSTDTFTRYFSSGNFFGSYCSPDGNHIMATTNTGSLTYRHVYSQDKGSTWTWGTTTIASTSIQSMPLISSDGQKMWTITYNGSTQTSCFLDLTVSTTWDTSFGTSQWLSSYGQGAPSVGQSCISSTMKYMMNLMVVGGASSSNNAFYSIDTGTTWIRWGTTIPALSAIKIRNCSCSKNGQYVILISSTAGNMYKIQFPTTNI